MPSAVLHESMQSCVGVDEFSGHCGDVNINQCSDRVSTSAAGDGRSESRGERPTGETGHAQSEEGAGCCQAQGVREN